jgi:hypothetical protein
MSDEKRALTRPSAPPSEADYEAILAAVMETGRGRWFLHEYAQRNRHAETRGVLSAIQRIEGLLRAQGGAAPETVAHPAAAQIADAIDRARNMLGSGVDKGAAQNFEPVVRLLETVQVRLRGATTRLQDAAAALREEGGHTRICNDLDRQTRELDTGLAQLDDAAGDVRILVGLLHDIETELATPLHDMPPPAGDMRTPEVAVAAEPDTTVAKAPAGMARAVIAAETPIADTAVTAPQIADPPAADTGDAGTGAPAVAVVPVSAQPPSSEPSQPVSGPADFLLEPLPEDDDAADFAEEAPPPPAPAVAPKAQPQTKPNLRIDNFDPLAPLRALSDEEKVALFS